VVAVFELQGSVITVLVRHLDVFCATLVYFSVIIRHLVR
jgi:hypothetical protein